MEIFRAKKFIIYKVRQKLSLSSIQEFRIIMEQVKKKTLLEGVICNFFITLGFVHFKDN